MNEIDSPSTRFNRERHAYTQSKEHFRPPIAKGQTHFQVRRDGPVQARSYFEIRPKPAASPTATLVADLSQNFHLGASPAVPTPRRSLMAQFSFHEDGLRSDVNETPLTPYDDAQSSPGDIMDVSPLPVVARKTLARSTSMFEPQSNVSYVPNLPSRPPLHRAPLMSRNAFSAFPVPAIPEKRPFVFGRSTSTFQNDKENDLTDQFEESPKKNPGKFFGLSFGRKCRESSSPSKENEIDRSPLGPVSVDFTNKRRLPQFRRTQSMITKNDDFLVSEIVQQTSSMYQQQIPASPEQASVDCQVLPSFESKADQLKRITGSTFAKVLEGRYKESYDRLEVIDCRFPHEYEGGHIPHAINVSSLDALDKHPLLTEPLQVRTLIILHCEYSAHRAPRIALHLRNWDRTANAHRYPKLFYPEVYILDGGYSNFYKEFRQHVGGSGYVEMNDPVHKPFASKQMHNFRKNTKFQRTNSYTFGQDSPLLGGARMEREHTFKLSQTQTQSHIEVGGPFVAPVASMSPPSFQSPPKRLVRGRKDSESEIDDSGDCSMMDVDDAAIDSPLPTYSNTSNNAFQRTHGRTSSGRIDPRRMSSF